MGTKLLITNAMSRVVGLSVEEQASLSSVLSYQELTGEVDISYKQTKAGRQKIKIPKTKTKSLLRRDGTFPTGLLSRVEAHLRRGSVKFARNDRRVQPAFQKHADSFVIMQDDFAPLEWQVEAAKAALDADGRGIISAPTGTGKSFLACMLLYGFGAKTLIVVPSLTLKEQLTKTVNWLFGLDTAGPLVKRKAEYTVTIENIDALRPTDDLSGVDLLLIDEYHHAAATTYRKLSRTLWAGIYWRIGLTATPFRSRDDEMLLMSSIVSDLIYDLPYKKAVADGLIVPLEIYWVDAPKLEGRTKIYNEYHDAYRAIVVENEGAHDMIADLVAGFYEEQISTLVLCRQIDHGKAVQATLLSRGIDVPFAEGESALKEHDIQSFCEQAESTLLGTVGVLGEGVDTKPAEYVVIAGAGKAKVQFMQNAGRVFRIFPGKTSGKLIIVRYSGSPWLENHFDQVMQICRDEYGIEPLKLMG